MITVGLLYDGDGNRAAKSVSGVTTRYLVDDLNPIGYPQVVDELSGSGTVERTYTYGLQRISENQVINSAWTSSFYETDGEGSVRQLTNTAGAVTDTYDYDAFGNKINSTGTTPNNYLYRGEQFDSDLGMYYLRARYYNPLSGRFLSVDSDAGQGQRRYEYAGADPVDGLDPSGNEAIIEFALLTFYPKRLNIHFPDWCEQIGPIVDPISGLLPFCNDNRGSGGGGGRGGTGAGPGAPGGPPKTPPPCPKCFAQLKYRAVDEQLTRKIHATHSFWYVQDSEGDQYTVSGGPWPANCKSQTANSMSGLHPIPTALPTPCPMPEHGGALDLRRAFPTSGRLGRRCGQFPKRYDRLSLVWPEQQHRCTPRR